MTGVGSYFGGSNFGATASSRSSDGSGRDCGVLGAREFPLEHLAVNLELAADVVSEELERGDAVAERLVAGAAVVRAHGQHHSTGPAPPN